MEYIVACPDRARLETLCAFADHLATLPDPRDPRGVRHALPALLATLLVALAGDANSMAAVAAFTHDHQAWFRLWLPLSDATPSRDIYLRLVRRLAPETAVKAVLWLLDGIRLPGLRELVLALDGKVARHSGDPAAGRRALHLVSAFLVREGLTLAQEPCGAKGHEMTALPRLLDRLVLEGAVVTIDAAGCQTAIVQALRAAGADYVLALKRNQPTLHQEVQAAFDAAERGTFAPAGSAPCATTSPADPWMRRPCRAWSVATGGWRTACTAPWTCSSGRVTARPGAGFRRDGHPAPGHPEHGAHASAESQLICVHWPVARPHWMPALAPGPQSALSPTLRLP